MPQTAEPMMPDIIEDLAHTAYMALAGEQTVERARTDLAKITAEYRLLYLRWDALDVAAYLTARTHAPDAESEVE